MEGVAVSLSRCTDLDLIRGESGDSVTWQHLDSLDPDAILFDLEAPGSAHILSLLKERPGILLIGLDLACNRVIVLNSRQQFTPTMHDLYQMLENEVDNQLRFTHERELAKSVETTQPVQPISPR